MSQVQVLDPTRRGPEAEQLLTHLKQRVVGQDPALDAIVQTLQMYDLGISTPGQPVGSFLFLGPTGTGKTRVVEVLAECLFGNERACIKIDCGEFQFGHEISKLVGSPPGYLGHRETKPLLSQERVYQYSTKEMPIALLLFDEIEKANDALWNLLLGVLDKAVLTLGDNKEVDLSKCLIFMTSNLGAKEISSLTKPLLGFAPKASDGGVEAITRASQNAMKKKFTPEFINRIGKIVGFSPLNKEALEGVMAIELARLSKRLGQNVAQTFSFEISTAVHKALLTQGTDAEYGARHLQRTLDRELTQPLANLLGSNQIPPNALVRVGLEEGKLIFSLVEAASA